MKFTGSLLHLSVNSKIVFFQFPSLSTSFDFSDVFMFILMYEYNNIKMLFTVRSHMSLNLTDNLRFKQF
jgi:hypothetical protein